MGKKTKKAAEDCPMCVIHAENASRFYDKPPKIGKLKNGVCLVCGHVVVTPKKV
jgi:hypothetical protein